MPLVNIRLARRDVPTTAAQKAALIAGVTQLMQQVLDKRPESVTVIIDEVDLQNLFEAFSGIALECNRDEWMLRMRRMGSCPCKQPGASNRPISLQPFGQVPCRAVCGVAALVDSRAIHCAPRLASHPGKGLVRPRKCLKQVLVIGAKAASRSRRSGAEARGRRRLELWRARPARLRPETAPCARPSTRSHPGGRPAAPGRATARCGRTRWHPQGCPGG